MTTKVGRNKLCPCGSGKKYKKCCMAKDQAPAEAPEAPVAGKFKFEPGTYGVPESCMPSIACLKRSPSGWDYHFVLVKVDDPMSEDPALSVATADLEEAFSKKNESGSDESLAIFLKDRGYLSVDDFKFVDTETDRSTARMKAD